MRILHWFRKDLRLDDNTALAAAVRDAGGDVVPFYASDPAWFARPAPGEVPLMLRHRLLSLRAYDASGWMRGADVCEGAVLESVVARLFADPATAYLHVHNARPGCFNCAIHRLPAGA